jgi:hypothetical protein
MLRKVELPVKTEWSSLSGCNPRQLQARTFAPNFQSRKDRFFEGLCRQDSQPTRVDGWASGIPDNQSQERNLSTTRKEAKAGIERIGILPAVRVDSADHARFCPETLYAAGISVDEITMTVPGGIEVIRELAQKYPEMVVGAGLCSTKRPPSVACMQERDSWPVPVSFQR